MKRAKTKTASGNAKRAPATRKASSKPINLEAIRQQVATRVGNQALKMVDTTIAEVRKGHYLGMKYLFEMIGLYPAGSAVEEAPGDSSLARILLQRIGLPEETNGITKVSEPPPTAAAAIAEDAVE